MKYAVYAVHEDEILRITRPQTKKQCEFLLKELDAGSTADLVPLEIHEYPWGPDKKDGDGENTD